MIEQENRQVGAISYSLVRKTVKNLNLRVRSDCTVTVSASQRVLASEVDAFVLSKMEFIQSAQERFRQLEAQAPSPKHYISGEGFRLLGRELRLQLHQGKVEGVLCDGVYLHLTVKDTDDWKKKNRLIQRFFAAQRRKSFFQIVDELAPKFEKYGVARPELRIRDMKTRWGSCLPKKATITLNAKLIEMPPPCIEYVVLHELCHFIHPNHARAFYDFLALFMPDWKERKGELERYGWGM